MPDENTPSSTEPIRVEVTDPNAASAAGVNATDPGSVAAAAGAATSSLSAGNLPAETIKLTAEESARFESVMADAPHPNEALQQAMSNARPQTFEQMVEQRFMKLEAALMNLPAAIYKTQSEGSHDSHESFGARVLHHLFQTL